MISVSTSQYRVIGQNGEKKDVEANTAYEAYRMAEMKDAIKIERVSNFKVFVINKGQFSEDKEEPAAQPIAMQEQEPEHLKLLKNAVVSADDMDKIMRSLNEHAKVMVAATPEVPSAATSASGTEVHGDGFDEIIPAAKPAVPEAHKMDVAATAPQQPEASAVADMTLPPEKTLSPDEVEKLLNMPKS